MRVFVVLVMLLIVIEFDQSSTSKIGASARRPLGYTDRPQDLTKKLDEKLSPNKQTTIKTKRKMSCRSLRPTP